MSQFVNERSAEREPAVPLESTRPLGLGPRPCLAFAGIALIAVLVAVAFYSAAAAMMESWINNPMYSYGFLVAPMSAALIWLRRDTLRAIAIAPSLVWGSLVTAAGLLLLLLGRISSLSVLEQFSLVVTIAGLVLLLFGGRMLQALAFPIGYLIAMIPCWDVLLPGLHPYLQNYSAQIGVWSLQLVGIPVLREGFLLQLPNITLEVAEECSGVNNLIAVLCVGVPMAYLFVRRWWKRAVIVAASVLIALLSNGARVAMVSLLAYYEMRGADGDVHGPFSLLRSMLVSAIGFIVLFWLISRFGEHENPSEANQTESRLARPRVGLARALRPVPILVAVLMLASANGLGAWQRASKVPLQSALGTFPDQFGPWRSIGDSPSPGMALLNFDQTLSRDYSGPDGGELKLFIGYYDHQAHGRELGDHRMREAIVGPANPTMYVSPVGDEAQVKDFLVTRGVQTHHITYWYVVNGRTVADDYQAKLQTVWNWLSHGKTQGAVVVVRTRVHTAETTDAARQRLREFVNEAMAISKSHLGEP